jgi:ELWxxDGT repeat protein
MTKGVKVGLPWSARRAGVCSLALGVLLVSLFAGGAGGAPGDATATLVEDAVPGGGINPGGGSSNPGPLANVNGTLFFQADDGTNGQELWKSDGTPAGTTLVEDAVPGGGINPGANGSFPQSLTNVNGTLFFSAGDGINGQELWKSDGTPAGTTLVEDAVPGGGINPGAANSFPDILTNVNGTLFFTADDGTNGRELWKSDGTPAGTTLVEDSVPGGGISPGATSSLPDNLANVNGTLYLSADDGTNGQELWKSDGTPAGTTIVEDAVPGGGINPGATGSFPGPLANVNGTLYFSADDGTNGRELWTSGGTPAGTTLVEDSVPGGGINPGATGSDPNHLTNVNGTLFFSADEGTNGRELWKSDGTPAGTTLVEDAVPGGGISPGATTSNPQNLANVNGTLYLSADDGTNGQELWKATIEGPAPPVIPPASAPTTSQATGQRAAALKKCKKKFPGKAKAKKRKKCIKKAKKLPV